MARDLLDRHSMAGAIMVGDLEALAAARRRIVSAEEAIYFRRKRDEEAEERGRDHYQTLYCTAQQEALDGLPVHAAPSLEARIPQTGVGIGGRQEEPSA